MTTNTSNIGDVIEHGRLELVTAWGSDEMIIEAARQSTTADFRGWGPFTCGSCDGSGHMVDPIDGVIMAQCAKCKGTGRVTGDEKLLRTLYTAHHATPFEMAGLTVAVQAPIFVWREWMRHRTQSYNEFSARYSVMPDLAYVPSIERLMGSAQSSVNKQSSIGDITEGAAAAYRSAILQSHRDAYARYRYLIDAGVAREVARIVLPVAQFSKGWASANLRNWLGFLALRTAPGAQWEIRQFALAVAQLVLERFPRTYALWQEGNVKGERL